MSDLKITPLQEVARSFRSWRTLNGNKPYPTELWNEAVQHAQKSSVKDVALAIGVCRYYFQTKIEKRQQSSQFVEVLLPQEKANLDPSPIEVQISAGNGVNMTMRFDGAVQELIPVVERLFCRGEVS